MFKTTTIKLMEFILCVSISSYSFNKSFNMVNEKSYELKKISGVNKGFWL